MSGCKYLKCFYELFSVQKQKKGFQYTYFKSRLAYSNLQMELLNIRILESIK